MPDAYLDGWTVGDRLEKRVRRGLRQRFRFRRGCGNKQEPFGP